MTSENGKQVILTSGRPAFREHAKRTEGSDTTPVRNAPCFAVWAAVCDFSLKAECVPAFVRESERGPFVREVENRDEKRLGDRAVAAVLPTFSRLLIVGGHREPGNVCI